MQYEATEGTAARHHLLRQKDQEVHGSCPDSEKRLSLTQCETQTEDLIMLHRQSLTDTTIACLTTPRCFALTTGTSRNPHCSLI